MESLAQLRKTVAQVLQSQIGNYRTGDVKDTLIQSKELNRFVVICTGWFKGENFYGVIQDVELRADGTLLIHADNTDGDLAEDFAEAGISAKRIVKAYRSPSIEQVTRPAKKVERQYENQQKMAA